MVDGNRGEFTVLVDGRTVAQKDRASHSQIPIEEVLKAVREATPAGAKF
jgi:hypothetical protein